MEDTLVMEETIALPQRWALLLDPAAAQSVIDRVRKLELPRRICRPLDRARALIENAALRQFDAAVDAEPEAEADSDQDWVEVEVEAEAANDQDWAEFEATQSYV